MNPADTLDRYFNQKAHPECGICGAHCVTLDGGWYRQPLNRDGTRQREDGTVDFEGMRLSAEGVAAMWGKG